MRNTGSPPQVRGKRAKSRGDWNFVRITPAGAGKTQRKFPYFLRFEDHPRRCGENISPLSKIDC